MCRYVDVELNCSSQDDGRAKQGRARDGGKRKRIVKLGRRSEVLKGKSPEGFERPKGA